MKTGHAPAADDGDARCLPPPGPGAPPTSPSTVTEHPTEIVWRPPTPSRRRKRGRARLVLAQMIATTEQLHNYHA